MRLRRGIISRLRVRRRGLSLRLLGMAGVLRWRGLHGVHLILLSGLVMGGVGPGASLALFHRVAALAVAVDSCAHEAEADAVDDALSRL